MGYGLGMSVVADAAGNGVVSSNGEYCWCACPQLNPTTRRCVAQCFAPCDEPVRSSVVRGGMASTVFFVDPAEDLEAPPCFEEPAAANPQDEAAFQADEAPATPEDIDEEVRQQQERRRKRQPQVDSTSSSMTSDQLRAALQATVKQEPEEAASPTSPGSAQTTFVEE